MTQPIVDHSAAAPLLDRQTEQRALDRVLAGARAGSGASLVLRGAAGIGRTALLEYAVEQGADVRLARLAGTESERGLGFAALHRLLAPFLTDLPRLPVPQRDALRAAFGLVTADPPDRFLVGLAALTLLADRAADQPLLVAVDDAQWLDQPTAEVLGFVARRLATEPIAFVATAREPTDGQTPPYWSGPRHTPPYWSGPSAGPRQTPPYWSGPSAGPRCQPLDGLPTRYLAALPDRYARRLLASVATGPVPERVATRIVAESKGNPLALIEYGPAAARRHSGTASVADQRRADRTAPAYRRAVAGRYPNPAVAGGRGRHRRTGRAAPGRRPAAARPVA